MNSCLAKLYCLLLLSFMLSASVTAQSDEAALERALYNLPDVSFKKISEAGDPYVKYRLSIKQPLDHLDPTKGFFSQRVVLLHKGFNNPTVMETQGYSLPTRDRSEVEKLFNANYLNIEYRFNGESVPDSMAWKYLTQEQATADLHHINVLFRNIYHGKWISTGISKGGSTTIYYKYFFPADVDLAIPYVAPIDNSLEDKRIYTFLDTIGSTACRNKIRAFQIFLLKHEKEAVEKLKWYSKGANLHYDYTGSIEKSFEYAVLEYPYGFWQYYKVNGCDSVPANEVLDDYLEDLIKTANISLFADEGIKKYEAHNYQAATQSGYYGYDIAPFKKYLRYFKENASAAFPPKAANVKSFDISLNEKVLNWLETGGNNIIYIYGSVDVWTAAGITPSDKVNAKRFLLPGKNHRTARVQHMDHATQNEFVQAVESMTGIKVNLETLR